MTHRYVASSALSARHVTQRVHYAANKSRHLAATIGGEVGDSIVRGVGS